LASDFSRHIEPAAATSEPPVEAAPVATELPVLSPAAQRFKTCRWQQPAEGGSTEFCTHREVKPYAGTGSFDPEAWCGDCQHYKLRRVPKKRAPNDDWAY
jgi:hypothetical protein